jgi:hypothetical protein
VLVTNETATHNRMIRSPHPAAPTGNIGKSLCTI